MRSIKRFLLLIFLLSILKSKILLAGTVSFSNFDSKIEIQLSGSPLKGGFVSVGTAPSDINLTDRQLFSQSFTQFGNPTTFGGLSAFNLSGFFSGSTSGNGGSSDFLNENIYLLGGDGSTIQKSQNYFLINTGKTFKADSTIC